MKKIIIFILIVILIGDTVYSQIPNEQFDCQYFSPSDTNVTLTTPYGGREKPNRTDLSGGQPAPENSYFPVLIVFVQFKDEPSDPRGTWPQNSAPVYLGNLIAKTKNSSGNWWNWYNPETQMLSSHWAEISRGLFHVISPVPDTVSNEAFSVVLPKTAQEYFEFYNYEKTRADFLVPAESPAFYNPEF